MSSDAQRVSRRQVLSAAGAAAAVLGSAGTARAARPRAARTAYLGTYTSSSGGGTGIGIAGYDPSTGALASTGTLEGVADPSFLALGPGGRTLYAVDEQSAGAVTAAAVSRDGGLSALNTQPTGGDGPCHLSVHPGGDFLLSANYNSGSLAVHPIAADGSLGARTDLVQHTGSGPDPDRQAGPHAHMVLPDPAGRYVLAVDLGNDSVYTYRLDPSTGRLTQLFQAHTEAGAGPRHLAFHPTAPFAYLANELGNSLMVCTYDPASGELQPGPPQPTVPAGEEPPERNYPAEVAVSSDGRFVYVSNRGHNSVARFAVESDGSRLTLLDAVPTGGAYPRHFALSPSGTLLFAANQNSNTIRTFRVNPSTGELTPSGDLFETPIPVCVVPV